MSLADCDTTLAEQHDAILLDLDGVVYRSKDAVPGAVEALNAVHGSRLAYLTNNANRTPDAVVSHLRELGLDVSDADVITSAQAIAAVMAHDLPAASVVFAVGGDGLRSALRDRGLVPVGARDVDGVAAVVQGYSPDLGWRDLAEVAYAVHAGLPWYASNTDLTIPTAHGIAPGNGSLVRAVSLATGTQPVVAGKPFAPLFDETLARIAASSPLMVGDRLDTDILGARNASVASLMVLTGVNSLADAAAADPAERPDFIAADLAGLHESHPQVQVDDATARCLDSVVGLDGDRVVAIERGTQRTALLRAVVTLAWTRRDRFGEDVVLDETLLA